jgi:hypothetical protein
VSLYIGDGYSFAFGVDFSGLGYFACLGHESECLKAMSYYLEIACESIFNGELILDAQPLKASRDMSDKKIPAVSFSAAVSND